MLRPDGVTNHVGRISIKNRSLSGDQAFLEHVRDMREGMRTAIDQIITCEPTHLVMGVAIEAFWGGVEGARQLEAELVERSGVSVSIGSHAIVAALAILRATTIAVLTPHPPRGDERVRTYFEEAGFTVRRHTSLNCVSPIQIAHTTRMQIEEGLRTIDDDGTDAIVQVGTNLAAVDACAAAERWAGKPVLAINAVTYWDALRRSGIHDKVIGHGSLLERF